MPRVASAQQSQSGQPQPQRAYSDLERETIDDELKDRGWRRDRAPDGKRIESIEIVPLDVFDERDPVPDFVNAFHATSRRYVIRRELLFRVGHPYDSGVAAESARNLRQLRQLSLVLIVPARGSSPDSVRVLVITKDVWSLRLNSNISYSGSVLDQLLLQPAEENLFGTHRTVGGLFVLEPDRYSLGSFYTNRRVGGSRILGSASANVILNRQTGDPEGSFGGFRYGLPLYSTRTPWGWYASVVWRREVTRRFVNGEQELFEDTGIPNLYRTDLLAGAWELTRSYGTDIKLDVSGGAEATRASYRTRDLSAFDPDDARRFTRSEVPVSDTRISPFVTVRSYQTRYQRVLHFNTVGLQEDYRLGYELIGKVYPASRAVGSSRDLVGVYAGAAYTLALDDGLVRALVADTHEVARGDRDDALLQTRLRVVTPSLGPGRLVYDGALAHRYRNYLNQRFVLGGESRPRGYFVSQFIGKDAVAQSVEFRSRGIGVLSAQVGAVAFYDVADAFDGFDDLTANHSVGFGIRTVFPQAERIVMRFDWGFPLNDELPGISPLPGVLSINFQQAFGMPALETPGVVAPFNFRNE